MRVQRETGMLVCGQGKKDVQVQHSEKYRRFFPPVNTMTQHLLLSSQMSQERGLRCTSRSQYPGVEYHSVCIQCDTTQPGKGRKSGC